VEKQYKNRQKKPEKFRLSIARRKEVVLLSRLPLLLYMSHKRLRLLREIERIGEGNYLVNNSEEARERL
jgi:hypothetical protein